WLMALSGVTVMDASSSLGSPGATPAPRLPFPGSCRLPSAAETGQHRTHHVMSAAELARTERYGMAIDIVPLDAPRGAAVYGMSIDGPATDDVIAELVR